MKTKMPPPGKYILAVSGGVDSMVLLHLLYKQPGLELIVAHFNHGIRTDSKKDEQFVKRETLQLGLKFEAGYGKLGTTASEEKARTARYKFLNEINDKYSASGIITAHHQDDLIETALLNTIRGTKHRGLVSMELNPDLFRPLLPVPKKEILSYALKLKIKWQEDPTNKSLEYTRNYLRHKILVNLTAEQRRSILDNVDKVAEITPEIESIIATLSHITSKDSLINRQAFIALPTEVASELMTYWLKQHKAEYDKKLLEKLSLAIKTASPGTKHDVNSKLFLNVGRATATLESRQ